MGNEFGCEVCSNSNPRYEIKTDEIYQPLQKERMNVLDTEVIPWKLRKVLQFHSFTDHSTEIPELQNEYRNDVLNYNHFQQLGLYYGDMERDQRNGKGIQYCNLEIIDQEVDQKNEKYMGQWKNDYAEGVGVFIHQDDSIFVGQWVKNFPEGMGVFLTLENTVVVGQWSAGMVKGSVLYQNNYYTYHGQMQDSLREGIGECRWSDGSWYKGMWHNDNMEGFGIYQSRYRYEGMFVMNLREGFGVQYPPDGSQYIGQFLADAPHGHGVYVSPRNEKKHVIWQMGQEDGLVLTEQGGFRFNDGVEVKQYQSVYVDRLGDMTSEDYENEIHKQKERIQAHLESKDFIQEESTYTARIGHAKEYLIRQQQYVKL